MEWCGVVGRERGNSKSRHSGTLHAVSESVIEEADLQSCRNSDRSVRAGGSRWWRCRHVQQLVLTALWDRRRRSGCCWLPGVLRENTTAARKGAGRLKMPSLTSVLEGCLKTIRTRWGAW